MRKRPLGKTQKKILEILQRLKDEEQAEWVSFPVLIILVYRPQQYGREVIIDGEKKREFDWSYNQSEFISTHRAVYALERRGLVRTRLLRLKEAMLERKPKFGGIQWRKQVQLVES